MVQRVAVAVLSFAIVAAPLRAPAANLVPMRILTYDLTLTIGAVTRTPRPAGSVTGNVLAQRRRGGMSSVSAPPAGADSAVGAKSESRGSIVVDVIAATLDGGLVVDEREDAVGRSRPPVRFAIARDGTVSFDPKNADKVNDEEIALARWLARGLMGEHPRQPGVAWTVDQTTGGAVASEHYRVTGVDEPRVTLLYGREETGNGADSYTATRTGSLVYDVSLVVPVQVSYTAELRRQLFEASEETRTSVTLTLTGDSFAKKRSAAP